MINYSIIVPCYNNTLELMRSISSIPQRADIEIIVVDDNSPENIIDNIKDKYSNDKRLSFYKNEINSGAGFSRNFGLSKARGKWVLFLDSDDEFLDEAFSVFDKYMNNDADVIYFDSMIINSSNLKEIQRASTKYINSFLVNDKSKFLRTRNWEPWGKLFSLDFIKSKEIRFSEVRVMNDAYFTIQAGVLAEKIDACVDKVYKYNLIGNSVSRQRNFEKDCIRFEELLKINKFLLNMSGYSLYTLDLLGPYINIIRNFGIKKIDLINRKIGEYQFPMGFPIYSLIEKIRRRK